MQKLNEQLEHDMNRLFMDKVGRTMADWAMICEIAGIPTNIIMTMALYNMARVTCETAKQNFKMSPEMFGRMCEMMHRGDEFDEEYARHGNK